MKHGFTMIELIFVIVILGILAAVAIPKMTATRADAVASAKAYELATAVEDFAAYYTARGTLSSPQEMSNVDFGADNGTDLNASGASAAFLDCISIIHQNSALIVRYDASAPTPRCQNVALAAREMTGAEDKNSDSNKTFAISGGAVAFN